MIGPISISNLNSVPTQKPGAYILSRDARAAHYVGRSDTDLAGRIRNHINQEYTHYWFEETTSPMQAYYLECEWYHKYSPSDNKNHPAAPPGSYWRCPIQGCRQS